MVKQGVDQGAVQRAGRGVRRHSSGLVDDDQVGVFEEDAQGNVLRLRRGRLGRRNVQRVGAGGGLGRGVGQHGALAAELPARDQSLDADARDVGPGGGQRLVQPLTDQIGRQVEGADVAAGVQLRVFGFGHGPILSHARWKGAMPLPAPASAS